MANQGKVDVLLNECGAVLERNGKHEVWKLPNGNKFTRSKTPSDTYAAVENQMRDLRHALGMVDPTPKTEEGERRTKKTRSPKVPIAIPSMASALQAAGVIDPKDLTDRIDAQRKQLATLLRLNEKYRSQRKWLLDHRCWWCRFKQFWHRWWSGHNYEFMDVEEPKGKD